MYITNAIRWFFLIYSIVFIDGEGKVKLIASGDFCNQHCNVTNYHEDRGNVTTVVKNTACRCSGRPDCRKFSLNSSQTMQFREHLWHEINYYRDKNVESYNMHTVNYDLSLEYQAYCQAIRCNFNREDRQSCQLSKKYPNGVSQVAIWDNQSEIPFKYVNDQETLRSQFDNSWPRPFEGDSHEARRRNGIPYEERDANYRDFACVVWATYTHFGCAIGMKVNEMDQVAAHTIVCNFAGSPTKCATVGEQIFIPNNDGEDAKTRVYCQDCNGTCTKGLWRYYDLTSCGEKEDIPEDVLDVPEIIDPIEPVEEVTVTTEVDEVTPNTTEPVEEVTVTTEVDEVSPDTTEPAEVTTEYYPIGVINDGDPIASGDFCNLHCNVTDYDEDYGNISILVENTACSCKRSPHCRRFPLNASQTMQFRENLWNEINYYRDYNLESFNLNTVNYDVSLEYQAYCFAMRCHLHPSINAESAVKDRQICLRSKKYPNGLSKVTLWKLDTEIPYKYLRDKEELRAVFKQVWTVPYEGTSYSAKRSNGIPYQEKGFKYEQWACAVWATYTYFGCSLAIRVNKFQQILAHTIVCMFAGSPTKCATVGEQIFIPNNDGEEVETRTYCKECPANRTCVMGPWRTHYDASCGEKEDISSYIWPEREIIDPEEPIDREFDYNNIVIEYQDVEENAACVSLNSSHAFVIFLTVIIYLWNRLMIVL